MKGKLSIIMKRGLLLTTMFALSFALLAQKDVTVSGKVTDDTGLEVIGATVIVAGDASIGTVTDYDGNYILSNVPSDASLQFSYVGLKTEILLVNGRTRIDLVMKSDTELLDEVVVVGYGVQKRVNVTGAVSSIDSKALSSRPVQNVSQALQGVIPGLNFSQNNSGGSLNSQMSINVRGAGTIGDGSSSSPLILIDGVEGNLNAVNPADIENISVLKDAASSSIYGSRAAFGVILVTTKSGKSGRTNVSYQGNVRFSNASQVPEMLDSYRFAQYFNEAAKNSGQGAVFGDEALKNILNYQAYHNGTYTGDMPEDYRNSIMYGTTADSNDRWLLYGGGTANTNWFGEMYKNWAPSHEHNLSVSGGTEKVTYHVSGSFLDQNGLIRHGEDIFNRFSLNGKVSVKISDNVTMNYNNRWVREDYSRPSYLTGLFFHNIARRWPTNAVTDPNGNYIEGNEILQMKYGGKDKDQKDYLYQQLQFVFEPIKDWFIRAEGNYTTINRFNHWDVLPIYGYDANNEPFAAPWSGGDAGQSDVSEASWKENFFSTNLYTDYSFLLNDHSFKVMAGSNIELMKTRSFSAAKKDLITPDVPTLGTATNSTPRVGGGYAHWATLGFFGRVNYNYKEKYLLEANIRRDGTSRFIGDKTWGTFPSFSVGWNIANEDFFAPLADKISSLKLRGSWGQLGNMNTNAWYPFFQSMPVSSGAGSWLVDGKKPTISGAPGIVSSMMTWETIQSWNVGADWITLNGRFTGAFDVFKRTTKNMIGPAPELSSILGTGVPKVNNADMESYGWELELNWRDQIEKFSYGVKLVVSDDQQRITKYPNDLYNLNTWYNGRKNGEIWGYTTVGIAKSDSDIQDHLKGNRPSWGSNWAAGDVMYKDLNGDGVVNNGKNTLDDHGDLSIIGNNTPRYKFGLTLDGEWNGFDFRVFLQGVAKRDYVLGGAYFWGADAGGMWQSAGFVDHWDFFRGEDNALGANLDAYYPRPLFGDGKNHYTQTRYLQNAAYLRLKNVQIGYTLPKNIVRKVQMENVRFYVSGDNLATISQISGVFDPELLGGDWGAGKLYPLSKVLSVGLNINF